jgi:hypothetical protein
LLSLCQPALGGPEFEPVLDQPTGGRALVQHRAMAGLEVLDVGLQLIADENLYGIGESLIHHGRILMNVRNQR